MKSALVASVWLFSSVLANPQWVGCYKSSEPLSDEGHYQYQSQGYCQNNVCIKKNAAVFALLDGGECYCGNELPPESSKVASSECNVPCIGYDLQTCGGTNVWGVYLTGLVADPPTYSGSNSSSTSTASGGQSTTSAGGAGSVTAPNHTVFVTPSSSAGSGGSQGSGASNATAIAVGVVVGAIGFSALVGAIFFYYRHKKRKEVEEEYRRTAVMTTYNSKRMSENVKSDSRFDGDYMAQRRQSNGSIDDDQDFSRRILQVTNPDR